MEDCVSVMNFQISAKWQALLCQFLPQVLKVERTFITIRNILSDKRLSISHSTLNDNLIVYCNDSLWNKNEKEKVIKRAVDLYLKTKRKMKINIQESIQLGNKLKLHQWGFDRVRK